MLDIEIGTIANFDGLLFSGLPRQVPIPQHRHASPSCSTTSMRHCDGIPSCSTIMQHQHAACLSGHLTCEPTRPSVQVPLLRGTAHPTARGQDDGLQPGPGGAELLDLLVQFVDFVRSSAELSGEVVYTGILPTLFRHTSGPLRVWLEQMRVAGSLASFGIYPSVDAWIDAIRDHGVLTPWIDTTWLEYNEAAPEAGPLVCGELRTEEIDPISRRGLQRLGALQSVEEAWLREWRERFSCWWLGLSLPTQSQLGRCMGAIGLHLGSRLGRAWSAMLLQRGGGTHSAALASTPVAQGVGKTEAGCEWVEQHLELPDIPSFPSDMRFRLPPVPNLCAKGLRTEAPALHALFAFLPDLMIS